jgi:pseudouridine kinase
MEKEPHVVVIGAINADIKGRPYKTMMPHTSNPGKIEVSAGGVGRNIAENLCRLKVKTTLISVMGRDPFSEYIKKDAEGSGVSFEHVHISDKHPTGLFTAFINNRGDLMNAIADMSILTEITPEFLKSKEDILRSATFMVLDADVPGESVDYLLDVCRREDITVCVEPVSVEKSILILPFLDRITMVTPNREEAEALAGFTIEGAKGVVDAGEAIMKKGVKCVIITLGAEGVYIASAEMCRFISSISTVVEDSVGSGDSLVAGMICGLCNNRNLYDSIRTGIASATLTLSTRKAVHPDISPEYLEQILSQSRW